MSKCTDQLCEGTSISSSSSTAALEATPKPFALQAAGHQPRNDDEATGLLEHADHSVLKPLTDMEGRGLRELSFYKTVFDPACQEPVVLGLRPLLPQFRGTVELCRGGKMVTFLKLENLTAGYRFPCVMDVKMGSVTSDPEASPSKVEREREKYKQTKILGFCIPGMMIYNMKSGKYISFNKEDGKRLKESTVKTAFLQYLGGREGVDVALVTEFCRQLRRIRDWFLVQRQWAFYSSSLLFIYDAMPTEQSLQISVPQNNVHIIEPRSDVRMIDFAHVFPDCNIDSNYLFGLNNVIGLFEEILHDLCADED